MELIKNANRKGISFIFVLAMVISLILIFGATAFAGVESNVEYIDEAGTVQYCAEATVVESTTAAVLWSDPNGWLYAPAGSTINLDSVNVVGATNLILADSATVNITGTSGVALYSNLTVYSQTNGTGTLNISATTNCALQLGGSTLEVYGGSVNIAGVGNGVCGVNGKGGWFGDGYINIFGGNVNVTAVASASAIENVYIRIKKGALTINSDGTVEPLSNYYFSEFTPFYLGGVDEANATCISVIDNYKYIKITRAVATVTSGASISSFDVVKDAIDYASAAAIEDAKTVQLITDVELAEDISIPEGYAVMLDLNGCVLKGSGINSVIKSAGDLIVTDSAYANKSQFPHYFEYCSKGAWTYIPNKLYGDFPTLGAIDMETITDGDIIRVEGGIITGGKGCLNGSDTWGGGIYIQKGNATISAISIVGNQLETSMSRGGGICIDDGCATIKNAVIVGNTANTGGEGGGIYVNKAYAYLNSVLVAHNYAQVGAGINNDEEGTIEITASLIKYNSGTAQGGGIENNKGRISMSGVVISDNTVIGNSEAGAAGINNNEGRISMSAVTVTDNVVTAPMAFAAGILNAGYLDLQGESVIIGNKANGCKSNLYLGKGLESQFTISDMTDNASVGVTLLDMDTFTLTTGAISITGSAFAKNFKSDDTTMRVVKTSDQKGLALEVFSPVQLTVSGTAVDGKIYDGTTAAAVIAGTLENVDPEDVVTLSAVASFADAAAGKDKDVTVKYTIGGPDAQYYLVPDDDTCSADIEKRAVTLISASDSKSYDGTPLTNHAITVSGAGFAGEEGATYNVTGSQTVVGDSDNTFTYQLASNTDIANYTITTVFGKLIVNNSMYTVTFDVDGGTPLIDNQTVHSGECAANPSAPTKSGYSFAGWYNAGSLWDFSTPVTSDLTLVAYWDEAPAPVYYDEPDDEPDPVITVPVSGDKDTVKVEATVSGTNATVKNVTTEEITKVGTEDNVVIDLSGLSDNVSGVTIPKKTFENVANSEADGLEIRMPNGTVAVFDKEALSAIAEQAKGSSIKLVIDIDSKAERSMTSAQKETVKEMNKPAVLDAYFTSNGTRISDFKGGEADITAEYPTEYPVRVWYVADDGSKELVPSTFDGKVAKFTVTHFSHYVVEQLDGSSFKVCPQDDTCVYAVFTDANTKAWYHDGVHFCVEKGIMSGYGKGLFGPGDDISRGMIVTMLYALEGRPAVAEKASFTDVKEGKWYSDAIAWAEDNNIVSGYKAELFGPELYITREELATILKTYAAFKGYDVSASEELTAFTDANLAGKWAVPALKWAKAEGLISGIGNNTLLPKGTATRAEAAMMIKSFCEKYVR